MILKLQTYDHTRVVFETINENFAHLEKRIAKLEAERGAPKEPAPDFNREQARKKALKNLRRSFIRLRSRRRFRMRAAYGLACKLQLMDDLQLVSSDEYNKLARRAMALRYEEQEP
jgi:hypothetical protein